MYLGENSVVNRMISLSQRACFWRFSYNLDISIRIVS